MIQTTNCFLLRDGQILLAMKKRGQGVGRWNGTGGKLELGETVEQAVVREAQEEIGVTPLRFSKVGEIDFTFTSESKNFENFSHIYLCGNWKGEPVETDEMRPQWFDIADVPYADMWPGDDRWLPQVLDGKLLKISIHSGEGDEVMEYSEQKVLSF